MCVCVCVCVCVQASVCVCVCKRAWFGLFVGLLKSKNLRNGFKFDFFVEQHISFPRLFTAKAILGKEELWCHLTPTWGGEGFQALTKGISHNKIIP